MSVVGQLVFSNVELGNDFVVAWKEPHPSNPAKLDAEILERTTAASVCPYTRVPKSKFPEGVKDLQSSRWQTLPSTTPRRTAGLYNRAYDITRFIDRHPGGVGPIVNMAGRCNRRLHSITQPVCTKIYCHNI